MQFAFGITAYDLNQDPIDDPTYGNVVAKYVSWGFGEDNLNDPIPMKPCSDADLGITVGWNGWSDDVENNLDRSETRFFPINSSNIHAFTFYRKKLRCFDYPEIEK